MAIQICPRCSGSMYADRDIYGEYRICLQCGYMVDVAKPAYQPVSPVSRSRKGAAA